MDKKSLSERDVCTKFITPALRRAGWDEMTQIREEVSFTKGRLIVRGKLVSRGQGKRADYVLTYKPNVPIALIEAKDNHHAVGDGMQQALDYADTLDVPFVFSSNGDGFVFHDRTGASGTPEKTLALDAFPSPRDLWARYRAWKGLAPEAEAGTIVRNVNGTVTINKSFEVYLRPLPGHHRPGGAPEALPRVLAQFLRPHRDRRVLPRQRRRGFGLAGNSRVLQQRHAGRPGPPRPRKPATSPTSTTSANPFTPTP